MGANALILPVSIPPVFADEHAHFRHVFHDLTFLMRTMRECLPGNTRKGPELKAQADINLLS